MYIYIFFFFVSSRIITLLAVFTLGAVSAFETDICDCSQAARKGFVKFDNEDCKHLVKPGAPTPVMYKIITTLPVLQRFIGHTCSMWRMSKSVYRDFLQWDSVTESRTPLEVSSAQCRKMRDSRLCNGAPMDNLGSNKWALEKSAHVQGSWLRTNTDSIVNCRLEEVILETECADCTISSPLGDIPGSANGSLSHNLVTIVWDNSLREVGKCKARLVEEGLGLLYNTTTPDVLRLRDSRKQMDFMVKNVNVKVCDISANMSKAKAVMGMDRVVTTWYPIHNSTHAGKAEIEFENVSSVLRAEIDSAAHAQYMRDFAVEMSNSVAKEVRELQCKLREITHRNAIATAQYNGWIAAGYLNLPKCYKLLPVGKDVAVLQCSPRNITFTTEITNCGPQPRHGNFTISVEGWELTEYSECYWHFDFVNFNGRSHTFKNGTWVPMLPSVLVQGDKLIGTMPYEVDASLGNLLHMHPALKINPMSPAAAIADILAAVQEQHSADFTSNRHISNVLLSRHDAPHISFLSRMGSWIKNFGSISGIGLLLVVAFRSCGLGSMIIRFVPYLSVFQYCNPFKVTTSTPRREDVELGLNTVSSQPANPPINIINISPGAPPPDRPLLTVSANRTAVTDQEVRKKQAALLLNR